MDETKLRSEETQISPQQEPLSPRFGASNQERIVAEVTVLAEATGTPVSPQLLQIYAMDLADLPPDNLREAFRRARKELKFFPKIAELRELAGAGAKAQENVEGEAAWRSANEYLRKYGVDRTPVFCQGRMIEAPRLPARIDYALRRIGGLWGLNHVTPETLPFVRRDFLEAYQEAPLAAAFAPRLKDILDPKRLAGPVRELAVGNDPGEAA